MEVEMEWNRKKLEWNQKKKLEWNRKRNWLQELLKAGILKTDTESKY